MVDVEEGKVGGRVVEKLKCLSPLRRNDENAGSDRSEKNVTTILLMDSESESKAKIVTRFQ